MARRRIITAALLGSLLAACGSSSSNNSQSGALNNCNAFQDLTAGGATITFAFPAYSPACVKIKAGQSVSFNGAFGSHPLTPGESPESPGGTSSPGSPIQLTNTGSTASFTFATAGTYGFYCGVHHSQGMAGAVQVVP